MGEPTSGLEPLTSPQYECTVSGCPALQRFANPLYVSGFLFPGLLCVAPYCVRARVKLGTGSVRDSGADAPAFSCGSAGGGSRGRGISASSRGRRCLLLTLLQRVGSPRSVGRLLRRAGDRLLERHQSFLVVHAGPLKMSTVVERIWATSAVIARSSRSQP